MEEYLGRSLPEGSVVHHKNRIRSDNRIENLLLLRNQDDHLALHRAMDSGDAAIVQAFEEWSKEFMDELKSVGCFTSDLAVDENEEINTDDLEKFVARRNKVTNKIFIEFDEEILISPDGKDIELDLKRFGEPEEVFGSYLTKKQLDIYRNKIKSRESSAFEHVKKIELQKKLFHELTKERKRLADKKGVPVYIVFDNKTLIEMSEIMPTSESLMLQVRGVGPGKFRLFGSYFIAVVKKFKKDNNIV